MAVPQNHKFYSVSLDSPYLIFSIIPPFTFDHPKAKFHRQPKEEEEPVELPLGEWLVSGARLQDTTTVNYSPLLLSMVA